MSIIYTWTFQNFAVTLQVGNLQKVVTSIWWSCVGVDADTGVSSATSGQTDIGSADEDNFISIDDITYDQTMTWLSEHLDIPAVQNSIGVSINNLIGSGTINMDPPFNG